MNTLDLYPHLIGLRFAITELLSELAEGFEFTEIHPFAVDAFLTS